MLFNPFKTVGGGGVGGLWAVSKVESLAESALPFGVYPAGKFQLHFTCGFDFRQASILASILHKFIVKFSSLINP